MGVNRIIFYQWSQLGLKGNLVHIAKQMLSIAKIGNRLAPRGGPATTRYYKQGMAV